MNSIKVIVFIVLQVIVIDGILSLDNAAVLGAMAAKLPPDRPAPLPPGFRRILGKNQREAALKVGLLGAYVGRSLMLFLGGVIIAFPILKVLGALYLFNLVLGHFEIHTFIDRFTGIFTFLGKITSPVKMLPEQLGLKNSTGFLSSSLQRLIASPFWQVVITVEVMDLVFSLDNVIAVLALSEYIVILIIGVCISILIMRFAATLFLKLIDFEPLLAHAAYLLILVIGVELILKYFYINIEELYQFGISVAIILFFISMGGAKRIFRWLQSARIAKQAQNNITHTQPTKYDFHAQRGLGRVLPTTDALKEPAPIRRRRPIAMRKTVLEGKRSGDTNKMPFTNIDRRY